MRLIDVDKFIERCKEIIAEEWNQQAGPASWAAAYEDVIDEVEVQPTVDAVSVVRCKDCEHLVCGSECYCGETGMVLKSYEQEEHFCSFGVRKNETN